LFLGEGNKFPLGGSPPIDPLALGRLVLHLVKLCYWYVGVFGYYYRTTVQQQATSWFAGELINLTPRIRRILGALDSQLAKLQEDLMKEGVPGGIGPAFLHGEGSRPAGCRP